MINKVILNSDSVQEFVETTKGTYIRVYPKKQEDCTVMWEKKVSKGETVEQV
jgi:hypothetical protein